MNRHPTMQDIGGWLKEITAFPVTVRASDERRAEVTVSEAYPVTLEAVDLTLNVTCDRELPDEVQNVVEMSQLQQAAFGQARSAAMPTICEARQIGGKQRVSFRLPLYLDGLTRNELATAIWEVWKAQELLALQIYGLKELEALSSELEDLEGEEEAPPPQPTAAPPPPPAAAPAGRFCSNCGRPAKPEHRFCIGCGTPLQG